MHTSDDDSVFEDWPAPQSGSPRHERWPAKSQGLDGEVASMVRRMRQRPDPEVVANQRAGEKHKLELARQAKLEADAVKRAEEQAARAALIESHREGLDLIGKFYFWTRDNWVLPSLRHWGWILFEEEETYTYEDTDGEGHSFTNSTTTRTRVRLSFGGNLYCGANLIATYGYSSGRAHRTHHNPGYMPMHYYPAIARTIAGIVGSSRHEWK